MTTIGRCLFATIAMLLVTSCAGYSNRATKLDRAIHQYNNALRWKNYKVAAKYIPAAKRKAYLEKHQADQESMRVLDFEIRSIRVLESKDDAVVVVRFTWQKIPSIVVKKSILRQEWKYVNRTWALIKQAIIPKPGAKTPLDNQGE